MVTLVESIKKHEGFRSKPYPDPIHGWDVPTFGIGFTYITEEEADYILTNRIKSITKELESRIPFFSSLPQDIQEVLIEMSFQLGVAGTLRFKNMLKALESNNYAKAAEEMLDSKWARQTPVRVNNLASKVRNAKFNR